MSQLPSSQTDAVEPAAGHPANEVRVDVTAPLPTVETTRSAAEVLAVLDRASRRGKLPGFRPPPPPPPARASGPSPHSEQRTPLFTMTDFGRPFEGVLEARHVPMSDGTGSELVFRVRLKPVLPIVYAVVLVLTVWPGVWLTDSMLRTYFTSYDFTTAYWYVPLTLPFVPWGMWTAIKKSRKSARVEAEELIGDVRKTLETTV